MDSPKGAGPQCLSLEALSPRRTPGTSQSVSFLDRNAAGQSRMGSGLDIPGVLVSVTRRGGTLCTSTESTARLAILPGHTPYMPAQRLIENAYIATTLERHPDGR